MLASRFSLAAPDHGGTRIRRGRVAISKHRPQAIASASASSSSSSPPVVIIGAGIAGLAAAVALKRRGVDTLVLEAAPSLRSQGLALSLWRNAWLALEALDEGGSGHGVAARVRAASGPPLRDFEFCSSTGRVLKAFTVREATFERGELEKGEGDGSDDTGAALSDEFRGVRRADLLEALLAELPAESVRFGVRGEVEVAAGKAAGGGGKARLPRVRLVPTAGGKEAEASSSVIEARCVVGADSARSALAQGPLLGLAAPRYNGYVAWRGVARRVGGQNSSSSGSGSVAAPPARARILLGAGVRAGVYPLGGGDTYWFVTRNAPAEEAGGASTAAGAGPPPPRDGARLREEALDAVSSWGPGSGVRELIEATPLEVLSRSRITDRWTFGGGGGRGGAGFEQDEEESKGGVGAGRVTLAGDALHPMSPNLGQGGCTALEDAVVLAAALSRAFRLEEGREGGAATPGGRGGDVVARALRIYERERVARTLPLTLRSAAVGFALQLPYPPVVALRDAVIERVFRPGGFLDHTRYDCRAAAQKVAEQVR